MPWDLGGVPPALRTFLEREAQTGVRPGRVLIPGCGSGYELRVFHELGYAVEAVEFSGPAVTRAREILGPLGERIVQANFFKHDFAGKQYDLVYERGFLCSLPPARWPEYRARMASLIVPGGRLAGLFLYGEEPEPPPFPMTPETAESLLGGDFRCVKDEAVRDDTVEVYRGLERWQEWERRSA